MVPPLWSAGVPAVMPDFRELLVEGLCGRLLLFVEIPYHGFLLLHQTGDERLFAIIDRLFVCEQFLDVVGALLVSHAVCCP